MAPRNKPRNGRVLDSTKPTLIKVGKHFIDPTDVARIREVPVEGGSRTMYIVDSKSNPNPPYPCWVKNRDIGILLEQFNVVSEEVD